MAVLGSDNISHSTTFKFNINSADRVIIDSDGRLLVGTSSARSNFDNSVNTRQFQIEGLTNASSSLSLVHSASTAPAGGSFARVTLARNVSGTVGGNSLVSSGHELGAITFQGNDGDGFVEAARIQASVDGTPGANDMPGRLVFSTTADGASSSTERMRIDSVGNTIFFAGNSAGNFKQFAYDDSAIMYSRRSVTTDRTHITFINPNGSVGTIRTSGSSTIYATSSDYRLKENVVVLDGAIDRLKQLPVHRFNFIADPDTVVDGFIAHEAQEIVPECVTGTKDGMEAIGTLTEWNGKVIGTDVIEPEDLTWEDSVEVTLAVEATYDEEGNELTPAADAVYETVTRTRTWEQTGERPVYQGIDQAKIVPLLTAALQEAIGEIDSLKARLTAAGI